MRGRVGIGAHGVHGSGVAHMPIDVHSSVLLTTKWSSSSTAWQRRPARSLPSGSLNPWHDTSSAVRMRWRCTFCVGVPAALMVGLMFFVPNTAMRRGALARPNSASHAIWSSTPSASPRRSTGHAGADQPRELTLELEQAVPLVGIAPPLAVTRDDLVEDGAELEVRLHRRRVPDLRPFALATRRPGNHVDATRRLGVTLPASRGDPGAVVDPGEAPALSKFDDYPIHQTSQPIATPVSGDIHTYDRYWFNGYQDDGEFYFGIGAAVP